MRRQVGVSGLRKHYGTKARRGTKTEHARKAAGKNLRYCLAQLEALNIVGTAKFESPDGQSFTMGKCLTKKGIMDMDRIALTYLKKQQK